jgi:hypothetical protein
MNRPLRAPTIALASLVLALVAGCGGDDGTPYTGTQIPPIGDAAAYFGVTPCQCYEFTREDGSFDVGLGVAVESVTDLYSVALEGQGTQYHVLRYRYGGQVKRTDFLRPTDPDLFLAGVSYGSQDWENLIRLSPAVPYLRYPLERQTRAVELASTWQDAPAGTAEADAVPFDYRVDFTPATAIVATDGGQAAQVATTRVLYQESPWADVTRHYVPRTGLVKLDLDLQDGQGSKTWVLRNIRQLGGGCPWDEGATIPADQICGSNP